MRRPPWHRLRPGRALFEQAKVCANHLANFGIARYTGSVTSTKLKVTGIDLFSAGDFIGGEGTDEIVLHDPSGGVYKKLVVRNDTLVGAVLYGDTADGAWYFKMVKDEQNIHEIRDHLMFGQNSSVGDVGHAGNAHAATMPDDAEVCGCNGVCKGDIVKAIKTQGLFTLEDVRKHHQGVQLLRLLHRPGRADSGVRPSAAPTRRRDPRTSRCAAAPSTPTAACARPFAPSICSPFPRS